MQPTENAGADMPAQRHPRGLSTLFFTEMWERFSYYGMRALLVLFMVDAVQKGGMGMTDEVATAIYGLYTAAVYLAALPGGWLADRLLGAQKSVWYGGMVIAAGHFTLAIPRTDAFYLGLLLVVIGTGLLKPNVSVIVGSLYPEGGARRDAGFTIFYMGINLGAAIGPLICSALGEKVNWHYGFVAAGVGMVLGLTQFGLMRHRLGEAGLPPAHRKPLSALERTALGLGAGLIVVVAALGLGGVVSINPVAVARGTSTFLVAVAVVYFGSVLFFGRLDGAEKRRVGVIVILFVTSAMFWAGFEQAGSSFNLFAERYTDRIVPWLNLGGPGGWEWTKFELPAGWFQSLGPIFVISLAPGVAWLWVKLAKRNQEPSLAVKFGWGLLLLAAGFLVMAGAAKVVAAGNSAAPAWLIMTYLVHTVGELCLSPVGLSSVTKLAPRRLVGQMMGTWFLATSLGNLIAGLVAGELKTDAVNQMPGQFLNFTLLPIVAGVALILLRKPIARWTNGKALLDR